MKKSLSAAAASGVKKVKKSPSPAAGAAQKTAAAVKKSPSAAAVGSKKAADLVKKFRSSGGSTKKITGPVKKFLSSSATAKKASAPVPVKIVSPLDSKPSKRKVATGAKSNHCYKKARLATTSSPTNAPLPMINRSMSGRAFTTTTKDKQHKLYYEELAPGVIMTY